MIDAHCEWNWTGSSMTIPKFQTECVCFCYCASVGEAIEYRAILEVMTCKEVKNHATR